MGRNDEIMKRSETLYGYSTLVSKVRVNEENGMVRADAIQEAINECVRLGILTEYLEKYASEVSNMLLQEWILEDAQAVWLKDGIEQGLLMAGERYEPMLAENKVVLAEKDAEIAKLRALIKKLLESGIPIDDIILATGLTCEEIEQLIKADDTQAR